MKKFSEYVSEATLAEKDLEKGKFIIDESDDGSVTFRYSKGGNEMNMFEMVVGADEEKVSINLRVNNKEVVMNGVGPRQRFIIKMREFLQKIK